MAEAMDALYGVGFRSQHYEWVTTQRPPEIDLFEIVSDNFMGVGGRPRFHLDQVRSNYPVLMHGVGLSIGSHAPLDLGYIKDLKTLADSLEPTFVSDHLSWGHFGRYNSHDLLPIVYTKASLQLLCDKLDEVQERLGRRFFLENASAYVAFAAGDYAEAEFFAELLTRTGAGILLDINNLYVNAKNLGRNPDDFLRALKPEQVGYFHLAGHSMEGDVLVDTHDQPVPDPVWDLFAKAKTYFPGKPAVIEWDGKIPEFSVLAAECAKARDLAARGEILSSLKTKFSGLALDRSRDESQIYQNFFAEITRPDGLRPDATQDLDPHTPTPPRRGMGVYNHAYFSRLEEVLKENFPSLAYILGAKGFARLLVSYLGDCPPQGSGLDAVGRGLTSYLKDPGTHLDWDTGVPLTLLADLAAMEWAQCEVATARDHESLTLDDLKHFAPEDWESRLFQAAPHLRLVSCDYAVLPVLSAIRAGEAPSRPEYARSHYLVYREGHELVDRELSEEEARFVQALETPRSFQQLADEVGSKPGHYDSGLVNRVAAMLMDFCASGLLASEAKGLRADPGLDTRL